MLLFRVARKRKARLERAVSNKPAQMPDRLCACEGAAGILGLCPHMQTPRLRRGIIIVNKVILTSWWMGKQAHPRHGHHLQILRKSCGFRPQNQRPWLPYTPPAKIGIERPQALLCSPCVFRQSEAAFCDQAKRRLCKPYGLFALYALDQHCYQEHDDGQTQHDQHEWSDNGERNSHIREKGG